MAEKSLSEMSVDELRERIKQLRDRRSQARERRIAAKNAPNVPREKKGAEEVSDALGSLLDDILGEQ